MTIGDVMQTIKKSGEDPMRRVMRLSSETRQAVLDEERQNFLEGSFENMLESRQIQNSDSSKIGTLDTYNAIQSNLASKVKVQTIN